MEYHRTKNIQYVQQMFGHRKLGNTDLYTQLLNLESDQWHVAHATNLEEENKLIEAGFEYVRYSEKDEVAIYRKPKQSTELLPNLSSITQGSGSIARLSIPAFRAGDPGPNPGRSTNLTLSRGGRRRSDQFLVFVSAGETL